MKLPDYYQILQVPPSATVEEIKKAYRKLALENHPDLGGCHERMLAINEAFYVLADPSARAAYDEAQREAANAEAQHRAEQYSARAASAAGDYPQAFADFNRWMDGMFQDFANARYGSTGEGMLFKFPTIKNSSSGVLFILIGGIVGAFVTWKLFEGGVKGWPAFVPVVAGMWVGQFLHGCAKATLVGNQPAYSPTAVGAGSGEQQLLVVCPKCQQKLREEICRVGSQLRCPQCRTEFTMR
jgi:hypothetical protein